MTIVFQLILLSHNSEYLIILSEQDQAMVQVGQIRLHGTINTRISATSVSPLLQRQMTQLIIFLAPEDFPRTGRISTTTRYLLFNSYITYNSYITLGRVYSSVGRKKKVIFYCTIRPSDGRIAPVLYFRPTDE
jgi:hypothetical protein